jgi:hypothetical protein
VVDRISESRCTISSQMLATGRLNSNVRLPLTTSTTTMTNSKEMGTRHKNQHLTYQTSMRYLRLSLAIRLINICNLARRSKRNVDPAECLR